MSISKTVQESRQSRKAPSKIYICDPVCIQGFGHNLAAVNRYSRYFDSLGIASKAFVSRLLEGEKASILPECIAFSYAHYYGRTVPASNSRGDALSARILDASSSVVDEVIQGVAYDELRRIIEDVSDPESTGIYFPSIDYYSFSALVNLLEKNPFRVYPSFFIRWIGVMENCCYAQNGDDALELLYKRLARLVSGRSTIHIRHSAESAPYAAKLSHLLDSEVITTPTLVLEEIVPLSHHASFVICFPGSARIDKGYDRIAAVLQALESRHPELDYLVYLQMLPRHELTHHYNVARELMKNPRIRCYPSHVSQHELTQYISASSLIVTPYCNRIYKMRSSAIMAEGACFGRQIVASAGCGFSEELSSLGLGICRDSDEGIADAIYDYSCLSLSEMRSRVKRGRDNYYEYASMSYVDFFGVVQ